MEEVLVDVDEPYSGVVVEKLSRRKGEMQDMRPSGGGKVRLTFKIPSRGLIGYHGEFLTDTRGTGIMNRLFAGYGPWKGTIEGRRAGSLISTEPGEAVHYALFYIQERGTMFVSPRREGLPGHDPGRAPPRVRSGSEPDQGKEADQHPRRRQG